MSSAQSAAATLPAELVSQIFHLALEDYFDPRVERRALFAFQQVCREWYLATLGWGRFVVASAKEAKALGAKLARDERERRKAPNGRRTRSTVDWPTSRARELVLVYDEKTAKAYTSLVKGCRGLKSLAVWQNEREAEGDDNVDALLEQLAGVRSWGGEIESIEINGLVIRTSSILGCLARLPALRIIDLAPCAVCVSDDLPLSIPSDFLSNLLDLRHVLDEEVPASVGLFTAIVPCATSLQRLTLDCTTTLSKVLPSISDSLATVTPNLLHFTAVLIGEFDFEPAPHDQADVLSLLRTMTNVQSLTISIYPDTLFFAAIRTLLHLHSLHLFIPSAVSPLEISASLADASFRRLEVTAPFGHWWDDEEVVTLGGTSEAAGISFLWRVAESDDPDDYK